MSTIQIQCINKTLTIIDSPSIDIGGVNSLLFSFCPLWDGYDKTVRFYKNETDCYPVDIVNDVAEIPSELISEGASFYFFIEGIYGEKRRRSQIFKLKVESSLLIVENADTDIQLRLIDLIEDMDSSFSYDDLSDEEKQKFREGLAAYQKKLTYHLELNAGASSFTLPDESYREGTDIVNIHLNGIYLHEGLDYTLSGRTVRLSNAIANPSTAEISIVRAVIINSNDYALLKGDKGDKGDSGKGISSIEASTSTEDGGNNAVTISLTDGTSKSFNIKNGSKGSTGATGVGISSVVQTTSSTADDGNNVITVTLSNGQTSTFIVQNGSKGSKGDKGDSVDEATINSMIATILAGMSINAATLNGKPLSSQSRNRDAVASIGGDGVMEAGKYIDFHESNGDADYSVRLTSSSGALDCSGTFKAAKVYNAVFN